MYLTDLQLYPDSLSPTATDLYLIAVSWHPHDEAQVDPTTTAPVSFRWAGVAFALRVHNITSRQALSSPFSVQSPVRFVMTMKDTAVAMDNMALLFWTGGNWRSLGNTVGKAEVNEKARTITVSTQQLGQFAVFERAPSPSGSGSRRVPLAVLLETGLVLVLIGTLVL